MQRAVRAHEIVRMRSYAVPRCAGPDAVQYAESPLEEELATFAGQPDGPQVASWQLRPRPPPQLDDAPRVDANPPLLPQPESAAAALAVTQLQLLGRVFAVSEEDQQAHILESVIATLAAEPPSGVPNARAS